MARKKRSLQNLFDEIMELLDELNKTESWREIYGKAGMDKNVFFKIKNRTRPPSFKQLEQLLSVTHPKGF